jgi:predicted ATPase
MEKSRKRPNLTSIEVLDFKAHKGSRANLGLLTMFVGANSAGKSSIIQGILALSQWLREGHPLDTFYFNGSQVRLGSFKEVLHNAETKNLHRAITFGIETNNTRLEIDVVAQGRNQEYSERFKTLGDYDLYGNPEVLSVSLTGKNFQVCLNQAILPNTYEFKFDEQTVWTEWVGDGGIDRDEPVEFGQLERKFEIQPNTVQEQSPTANATLLDLFSLDVKKKTSLGLQYCSFLTYLVAVQQNLRKDLIEPKVSIRFCSISEFLQEMIQRGEVYGSQEVKPPDPNDSKFDFLRYQNRKIQAIIRKILSSNNQEGRYFSSFLSNVLDKRNHEVLLPIFVSEYPETAGLSEPPQQLGEEDLQQVRQFFEKIGAAFDFCDLEVEAYSMLNATSWLGGFVQLDESLDIEPKNPVDEALAEMEILIDSLTKRTFYLGPLRVDGYVSSRRGTAPNPGSPVGPSGELTSLILLDQMSESGAREMPYFDSDTASWSLMEVTFEQAINSWFRLFTSNTGELTVIDRDKYGVQVEVGGRTLDQFGTGASQVLPILTLVLSSKPGDTVIIEQPELHIHPGGQQYLADFFIAASTMGIQIILETHSEYIVNRVRRAVIINPLVNSDHIHMVNFEQSGEGVAQVSNVKMTDSGGFADWPQGFFAQTEGDLLDILEALESQDDLPT